MKQNPAKMFGSQNLLRRFVCLSYGLPKKGCFFDAKISLIFGRMLWFMRRSPNVHNVGTLGESIKNLWFLFGS